MFDRVDALPASRGVWTVGTVIPHPGPSRLRRRDPLRGRGHHGPRPTPSATKRYAPSRRRRSESTTTFTQSTHEADGRADDEHGDRREERHLLERVLRHRRADEPHGEHEDRHPGPEQPSSAASGQGTLPPDERGQLLVGRRLRGRVPRLPVRVQRRRLRAAHHRRGGAARPDRGERPGRGGDRRSRRARRGRPHCRAPERPGPLPRAPLGARRARSRASPSSTGCASSSSAAHGSTTASRKGCSRSPGTRSRAISPTPSRAAVARCSSSRQCPAGTRCSSAASQEGRRAARRPRRSAPRRPC